ncbi:MAG: ABC transporter permease [Planctomycetota bacterium]|nr:ABC transporter permease [Planctomycetota bacterium]
MNANTGERQGFNIEKWGAPIALAALLVIAAVVGWPHFHKPQNLINVMRQASYTGIIALSMTFVIISGGIDLSVGSMAAFCASVGVLFMNWMLGNGLGEFWAVVCGGVAASILIGGVCGAVNGALITAGKIVPFIVTLGTMSIFRYLCLQMANAGEFASKSQLFSRFGAAALFQFTASGHRISLPIPIFALFILAAILSFLLKSTRYGRYLCAVGSNAKVAQYSAIRVGRVRFWAYVVNGLCVGVAASLLAARFNTVSTPNFGLNFEMDAIAATIIGGTVMAGGRGTVWGTVIGCFMLQIIQNMLNMAGISPYWQGVVKGIVIIVSVFIQKQKQ